MKDWKYTYNDNNIVVKNEASKCELYINDQKVDEHKGLDFYSNLHGTLDNGEQVLVVLHSDFTSVKCDLKKKKSKLDEISSTDNN